MMYKRRDTAIAELVANCWDAGAHNVHVEIPSPEDYDPHTSVITITDDGFGMNAEQIQGNYLVVGRNRRREGGEVVEGRPIMGRKGIGKLAGFGIATQINVTTWISGESIEFSLDIDRLKREDSSAGPIPIEGRIGGHPDFATSESGTRIRLSSLKHKTTVDIEKLREALSRRFSRKIRGEMTIYVNGDPVGEPSLVIEKRIPNTGYISENLPDGSEVKYFYAFSKETIKNPDLRGFAIYVRGKTAQAPPFFFNVEGTASGQHATRYVTGVIEADFLDEGTDDESDVISTDRQEIEWDNDRVGVFKEWGEKLARRVLIECTEFRGDKLRVWILENEAIKQRVTQLDPTSQKQVSRFLTILGEAEPEGERALELADALVRAYEYRYFHDVIHDIEAVSSNPEELQKLLSHLSEWKVLESRAVLEVVKGRLEIIDKFHEMVINDAPETASPKSRDNMHDLLGGYPWILNPEWQVLEEERTLSTQLRDWGYEEITKEDERLRYDFLALSDERRLVILEIKRADYAVTLADLQRLEKYKERLTKAHDKEIHMVMICGGSIDLSPGTKKSWDERDDGSIKTWSQIFTRTRSYYEHYRAVLEGSANHGDFFKKQKEVEQTRKDLSRGTIHRDSAARSGGVGTQDVDYSAATLPATATTPPAADAKLPASPADTNKE